MRKAPRKTRMTDGDFFLEVCSHYGRERHQLWGRHLVPWQTPPFLCDTDVAGTSSYPRPFVPFAAPCHQSWRYNVDIFQRLLFAVGRGMSKQSVHEVTQLLKAWGRGDTSALDSIIPLVYEELHRLSHYYLARERSTDMLQTTALVHEAYLRLINAQNVEWRDRVHFFAISANQMRRILVELARARNSGKRGGNPERVSLDEASLIPHEPEANLIALNDALEALAEIDPRQARVVELRFFGGLTEEEAAAELGISTDTVMRDWKHAKAWLLREMTENEQNES